MNKDVGLINYQSYQLILSTEMLFIVGFQAVLFLRKNTISEMEFKEFEPRFKSAKTRFKLSAGLNLETFDTLLSGINHI